ncbi:MAG: diaminopimelate decarboxylase [Verrucomicrobiales bacterium]|nr:diaminopimelate decarboxylase [Verrucomicrobiales bacterium]|tara:strand:- start:5369 stop:6667 length:1299 start_codon:yes stop_codon:yes gene_type:complete
MHQFGYKRGRLYCEQVSVEALAKAHGTPLFVYSQATLEDHFQKLDDALSPVDHLICYAMKANSNLGVMRTLANQGSGFDIVSGGELLRVIAAGGDAKKCTFAGVGKTEDEIELALRKRIYCFNVESEPELQRISKVAGRLKKNAPIAIRVNPNVDAKTHAKITTGTYENKFGIPYEKIESVYRKAAKLPNIWLRGVQMHIGSQLTSVQPFEDAVAKMIPLVQRLKKRHNLEFCSIGGGLGIVYEPALASGDEKWWKSKDAKGILTPAEYSRRLIPLLKQLDMRIVIEPGRFIAGNAGVLVTRVEYVKKTAHKNFVIVDAAMNDLIRPAFYESYHEILPLKQGKGGKISSDVVGPICESGDTFCKDRLLPRIKEGDYVGMLSSGAYGFVMASTYNSRPLAAEVLVNGKTSAVVRKRQPVKEIWAGEHVPRWLK